MINKIVIQAEKLQPGDLTIWGTQNEISFFIVLHVRKSEVFDDTILITFYSLQNNTNNKILNSLPYQKSIKINVIKYV